MNNFNVLIAVCCELREKLPNHHFLKNDKKIGEFYSLPNFQLIELDFHANKVGLKKGNNSVFFEVYETCVVNITDIDRLKGYYYLDYRNNINSKIKIKTPYGEAFTYLNVNSKITNENIIENSDYLDYIKNK